MKLTNYFVDLLNLNQSPADYLRTHCPWAIQVQPKRRRRLRTMRPWGLCVHTTGRGVVKKAQERGTQPHEEALVVYARSLGPHYCGSYSGQLYQLQADDRYGAHVGISAAERRDYLDGSWKYEWARATSANVARWQDAWPGFKSPQHLYPTKSPNGCYVGLELVPLSVKEAANNDSWWYTRAQCRLVAMLGLSLAVRYEWPADWWRTSRLVGHEDLDAKERWDSGGGWDPGALRDQPRFDWAYTKSYLREISR